MARTLSTRREITALPASWQREIAAGSEFGARAAKTLTVSPVARKTGGVKTRQKLGGGKRREAVGTALKERIEKLITIKTGSGCGCENLASQMDSWGLDGCERRREEIIGHLVSNRLILVAALKSTGHLGHAAGIAVEFMPEMMLRAGAGWLLDQAMADVRAKLPQRVSRNRTETKPPARFVFQPNPVWTSQTRHLTYHVWPTKRHDGWRWNLQQLANRWDLFNGVKVLGIAVSDDAESPEVVTEFAASLGMTFEHIVTRPNSTKLREVVTWVPMLQCLNPDSASHSEVVFSAHAKGVRHDVLSDTLESWASIMYSACLDDWQTVEDHLRRSLATGCFKRYNNFKTSGNDCWHYSGTFFWWRLRELAERNWRKVDQQFWGTESWLGLHCKNEETGCLFVDEAKDLYNAAYMKTQIIPQWERLRHEIGNRRRE